MWVHETCVVGHNTCRSVICLQQAQQLLHVIYTFVAADLHKMMGNPEAQTVVTMHVLVRPPQLGKAAGESSQQFGAGSCDC
jgi:hypothetical protein